MIDCLVLHHNDADGICSGAIVKYFEEDYGNQVELFKINYGYDIPWDKIEKARKVYIVDFCFQPFSDMIKLYNMKGNKFIWIDHHKSAIEDWEKSGQPIEGLRRIGDAGCELTWEYFSELKVPDTVRMIGRYDVWDKTMQPDTFIFHDGFQALKPAAYDMGFWTPHFENRSVAYDEMWDAGIPIYEFKRIRNESYCNAHAFPLEWEGLSFLAANALSTNSQLFDAKFNHVEYDAVLVFGFTNGGWSIGMFTDKQDVDVGAIAKKYGGGGHVGAAGFQCPDGLPFELPKKEVDDGQNKQQERTT